MKNPLKYWRNDLQCYLINRRKRRLNRVWRMNKIAFAIRLYDWNDPNLAKHLIEIIRIHREIPQYGYED